MCMSNLQSVSNKDIYDYFNNKDEHYPVSDLFMLKYQQNNGYRDLAAGFNREPKAEDKNFFDIVDQKGNSYRKKIEPKSGELEPNQKWHLLVAYYEYSVIQMKSENKEKFWKNTPDNWCFKSSGKPIYCPELLLWMIEATVDEKNMCYQDVYTLFYELVRFKEQGKGHWKDDSWWKNNSRIYWNNMIKSIMNEHNDK